MVIKPYCVCVLLAGRWHGGGDCVGDRARAAAGVRVE